MPKIRKRKTLQSLKKLQHLSIPIQIQFYCPYHQGAPQAATTLINLLLFDCPIIIILIEFTERMGEFMEYTSAPQAAKKWGIPERRVQILCTEGRIASVSKLGYM